MPGKRACRVRREAARKRPGFIQDEHGTSLGSPPYPGCSPPWSPPSGRPGPISTCTCRTAGRQDPQRRKKAGIPEKLAFATKPELAIAQVKRLMAAGIRAMWAAADEVYGRCGEFRAALRALGLSYVVIIPCDYRVTLAKNTVIRADQAIADAVFERRSCGNGTKGPRYSGWALLATADPREFLLIRRLDRAGKPVHVLPVLGAGRPARDHDVLHHHRRPPLASRNYFQNGKGRPRLGPVPGPDIRRDLPAHRPDRPRPAQDRRHPGRPRRRRHPPRRRRPQARTPPAPRPWPPSMPLTCSSTPAARRCPPAAASPARPASPRSRCPPPRPPASSASPATGKPDSSASPASPSISAGQHGADATRPAPAGTTTAPACQPRHLTQRRPEGGDSM